MMHSEAGETCKRQTNEVVIQADCSVNCHGKENNWIWSVQVDVTIMTYFNPDRFLTLPLDPHLGQEHHLSALCG